MVEVKGKEGSSAKGCAYLEKTQYLLNTTDPVFQVHCPCGHSAHLLKDTATWQENQRQASFWRLEPNSQRKAKEALVSPRSRARNRPHARPPPAGGCGGLRGGGSQHPGPRQQPHLITAEWITSQANAPGRNQVKSVLYPAILVHHSGQMSPFPLLMSHVQKGG